MSDRIEWSVQGRLEDSTEWLALARAADDAGCDTLYVADHPGTAAAPMVALAAAASVTERVRLGTCVANAGMWEPFALAVEIATLDVVASGRATLGLGAGHTPEEWTMKGQRLPSPSERVDRLIELTTAVQRLLNGEEVSVRGPHFVLDHARLAGPRPVQGSVPLLIGGNGDRVLRFAAGTADIVGVSGLGRTRPDGQTHETRWSGAALDETFELVRVAAALAGRAPRVEALVQHVELTADAVGAARRLASYIEDSTPGELLEAPFIWIGTPDEIASRLRQGQDRWGITRYVVRHHNFASARDVMRAVHGE